MVRFYQALGMAFTSEKHGKGPEHFAYSSDGTTFEIYPACDERPSAGTRIGFGVANVTNVFSKAIVVNAVVMKEPTSSSWGKRAVFRDSEGHVVELTETATVG